MTARLAFAPEMVHNRLFYNAKRFQNSIRHTKLQMACGLRIFIFTAAHVEQQKEIHP